MIELRPFAADDAEDVLTWIASEEEMVLWSGTTLSWPLSRAQLLARNAVPNRRNWTAADRHTGKALGHVSLVVDTAHRSGRLAGVLIAPEARGRGLGATLVDMVLDVAFDELHLHRVGLGVFSHNTTALRLYERLGFVREGVIRDIARVGGAWWSSVEMGMLDHERTPRQA
jgi:RimJ/RimL family protein N-acetyltransferase